ncbi:ribosome small subunit-dependent GTPase A [Collinsella tanakaei]|uniref:ribosome small subunit-dependent GTPase A n=1 Tax=Collinsella tanakaei TaxID=626935 RepID=UPI001958DAE9|nr:ribosome small subunit-dependent GTPase A [Collinsella tanakaei]
MGKGTRKSKGGKRRVAQADVAESAVLPRIEALHDLPAFDDLRVDAAQTDAFASYVAELARTDETASMEMRLGRVIRLDRGFPLIATKDDMFRAEHAVSFAKARGEGERLLPAVGDVVAVRVAPDHDMGVIERVLPRRTTFERWRGKNRGERQVLAANVDVIFIVQPLGAARDSAELIRDRIARALVLIYDCGAMPVVVFTKADRCGADELAMAIEDAHRLAGEQVRVIATSSTEGRGLDEVRSCVPAGTCAMILGESGAGKSTLLNALLGHEALATGEVRERDDMGRHTTVARVMVALPDPCGVIADAPGLRSLPLVGHERGLARAFPDIVQAARACRFNDCTHTHEPGCAVREAVAAGEIDQMRLDAFLSLASEMRVSAQSLDPDIKL